MVALVVIVLLVIGWIAFGVVRSNQLAAQRELAADLLKPNQFGCVSSPVRSSLPGVERVVCTSQAHAKEGEAIAYQTDPPYSGTHWPTWVNPGFYTEAQPPEKLVHSLEHGLVVIYYDPARTDEAVLEELRALTRQHRGSWDGVVAVPRSDPKHAIILTAWEHGLRLERYAKEQVEAFVDLFRGRGPENPVRPLTGL